MATYISMLRGINVSGQKRVEMKDLVILYESLGLKNVRTYVQSGNVIFDSAPQDTKELASMIETRVEQVFKFSAAAVIRTPDELGKIIKDNPFLKESGIDTKNLYVTFLSDKPEKPDSIMEMQSTPDKFRILNKEVYLHCPNGYGRTKYSNDFFEKKLGLTAITRNWNTVNVLRDMARK
jgi:uncharacterized protein (DUF1697 family)